MLIAAIKDFLKAITKYNLIGEFPSPTLVQDLQDLASLHNTAIAPTCTCNRYRNKGGISWRNICAGKKGGNVTYFGICQSAAYNSVGPDTDSGTVLNSLPTAAGFAPHHFRIPIGQTFSWIIP